ncbi:helix-turn-helix domain-containing protein [Paenibacillus methanolicus]|uniref:Cache domain-containing protein n=1 Tax=Paenibacillus methanolicus TaxID=582686 RepID=A0A5S5CHL3_9BACL|nr:helix-turn-helix domain-containing protein [Paenibacillus methanolicus]TYP79276.1 cache domain-containing protein [Paenibacillus methanolicus]
MVKVALRFPNRFVTVFGLLCLAIIVVTSSIAYYSSARQLQSMAEVSNTELLNQLNRRLELALMEIDKTVIALLGSADARRFFYEGHDNRAQTLQLQGQLANTVNSYANLQSVYLYAMRDNKILTDTIYTDAQDFYDVDWFPLLGPQDDYYAWTNLRPVTEQPGITKEVLTLIRSFPLTTKAEDRVGLVAVNLRASVIQDILSDLKRADGVAYIVDERGKVLAGNQEAAIAYPEDELAALISQMQATSSGFGKGKFQGDRSWVFYSAMDYTGWKWLYIVPESRIGETFAIIRNIMLLIAGVMSILAAIALMWANRFSYRPLEAFIRKVDSRVSGSQFNHTGTNMNQLESKFEAFVTNYSAVEQRLRESVPAMKLRTLLDVLTGSKTSYSQALPYLDRAGVKLYEANYTVLFIEFDHRKQVRHPDDWNLYAFGLCNVAEELVNADPGSCRGAAVQVSAAQSAVILSFPDSDPFANPLTALTLAESIRKNIEEHFKKTVTIAIGKHYPDFGSIRISYREATELLKYKWVAGTNTVMTWEDIQDYSGAQIMKMYGKIDKLTEAVRATDPTATNRLLDQLFDAMIKLNMNEDTIRHICQQVLIKASQAYLSAGTDPDDDRFQDFMLRDFDTFETMQDIRRMLRESMEDIIERLARKKSNKDKNELIGKVIAYIEENYGSQELSQNQLASIFSVSPSHLSRLFKEQTSINFLHYLIDVRMNAAKTLLRQTSLNVQDIALRVGYANLSSFLRIFKKFFGMTPSEMRGTSPVEDGD